MKTQSTKQVGNPARRFRFRMPAISTRVRLAFGMSLSVVTLLLVADSLRLLPNETRVSMQARSQLTETLAFTGSAMADTAPELNNFRNTLVQAVERNSALLSAGLRDKQGKLAIDVAEHFKFWKTPENEKSNDQFMFVPIFRNGQSIGRLELHYRPLTGFTHLSHSKLVWSALFMFACSFFTFSLLLRRTLRQLDPRGAVPRRVREAFDTMAEGLLIVDRGGNIMLANGSFGELTGVDAEQITTLNANEFPWQVSANDQEQFELPWVKAMREQVPVTQASLAMVDRNQKLRKFNVSAAPVMEENGRSRGALVTFDDITVLEEHKRELIIARNAADAANEAKSNFLSRMSHEIRTPMNAIIGYTDILREGVTDPGEQIKYLTTIQSSGEHLLALINDILDLSKVEAGQMTIERRSIQVVPLLQQVVETLKVKSDEKQLSLAWQIEGSVPSLIETDETRLRQILINTLGNAIKFTSEGGVMLVARSLVNNGKPVFEFDVADTGIGMSEKALQKIFDPFSQADDSVTRRFGGTGLGLAISKQLSESLGGGIRVRSQEGVGTVFTISIDPGAINPHAKLVTQETADEFQPAATVEAKIEKRFKQGHLLVVDDAQANRDLASLMIKRLGLTCDLAENGLKALECVAANNYDVILMDMHMPVMDGLVATKHLRDVGITIPIVALTAVVGEEEKEKFLANGFSGYLPKPIRKESLLTELSNYLKVVEVSKEAESESKMEQAMPAQNSSLDRTVAPEAQVEREIMDSLDAIGDASDQINRQPSPRSIRELPDRIESSLPLDEEMIEIIDHFVQSLSGRSEEFDVALEAKSMKDLKDLGHWLAGTSGTVGFDALVQPARELEAMDGENWQDVQEMVQHIKGLLGRVVSPAPAN